MLVKCSVCGFYVVAWAYSEADSTASRVEDTDCPFDGFVIKAESYFVTLVKYDEAFLSLSAFSGRFSLSVILIASGMVRPSAQLSIWLVSHPASR